MKQPLTGSCQGYIPTFGGSIRKLMNSQWTGTRVPKKYQTKFRDEGIYNPNSWS